MWFKICQTLKTHEAEDKSTLCSRALDNVIIRLHAKAVPYHFLGIFIEMRRLSLGLEVAMLFIQITKKICLCDQRWKTPSNRKRVKLSQIWRTVWNKLGLEKQHKSFKHATACFYSIEKNMFFHGCWLYIVKSIIFVSEVKHERRSVSSLYKPPPNLQAHTIYFPSSMINILFTLLIWLSTQILNFVCPFFSRCAHSLTYRSSHSHHHGQNIRASPDNLIYTFSIKQVQLPPH